LTERSVQRLPSSLVHSFTTSIHTSLSALLRLLALHLESALAGRLPQDLLVADPDADQQDRKLLAGVASFTQAVKQNRLKKREFPHRLELREVPYGTYTAVEFQHDPGAPAPPHALSGTFVLVPGPHGTTTVRAVAVMAVAAAPAEAPARTKPKTPTASSAGGSSPDPLSLSLAPHCALP
jgi:hypothetical protein